MFVKLTSPTGRVAEMETNNRPLESLGDSLTKQCEVLNLVLEHESKKYIARASKISPCTVVQPTADIDFTSKVQDVALSFVTKSLVHLIIASAFVYNMRMAELVL